ncbi:uncharacterized protein GIQ15_02057 [Arthroderma uncinatum]|uniref:uncharacterized protein n=1 Tax=Arthroderma uncinatum TaxID=74035 RepID=UPI00144AB965|nr:uncharacterized protein GIQ15_02057 [Arthroderma uncinatum]KAF3482733.1 hypothetical protein GIQ15_02057 [Arthroderma uncinatum]
MLSQIVTAARGLFKRPDGAEDTASEQEQSSDMGIASHNSAFSQGMAASQDSPVSNGKRKETPSSATDNTDKRPQKRRRGRPSLSASPSPVPSAAGESAKPKRYQVLESVTIVSQADTDSTLTTPVDGPVSTRKPIPMPKASYIRFGSEEPTATNGDSQEINQENKDTTADAAESKDANLENGVDDDDSSDDDAPEAFSNAAQLSHIRDKERKKEETKQIHEQLRREKRREHEKRLQLQAASKAAIQKAADIRQQSKARKAKAKPAKQDELQSESSMTLSAEPRDLKLGLSGPLPILLPDDILNAEPSTRPIITAFEMERSKTANPRHIRLTETADKPPKDLKVGSTAIRVLGDSGSGFNSALPPKSSNLSKRVRENWVGGKRKRGATGALRRTTGGPSSFVRK